MIQPARSDLVEGGKYTIVVRATDGGKPPLHSDVKVRLQLNNLNINQQTNTIKKSQYSSFRRQSKLPLSLSSLRYTDTIKIQNY